MNHHHCRLNGNIDEVCARLKTMNFDDKNAERASAPSKQLEERDKQKQQAATDDKNKKVEAERLIRVKREAEAKLRRQVEAKRETGGFRAVPLFTVL